MEFQIHVKVSLNLWLIMYCCSALPVDEYLNIRNSLIEEEKKYAFGGNLSLDGDEILANDCLMAAKWKEVDTAYGTPSKFLPAKNFMKARKDIEKSEVFNIIRKMPKGGDFHAHSSAMVDLEFIVKNMTHEPNLYICHKNKSLKLRFFTTPNNECDWKLVEELRKYNSSVDDEIRNYISLLDTKEHGGDDIWDKFEIVFDVVKGLIKYRPIFERYFYGAMQELYNDNVMFMEIRTSLSTLYEIDGTFYDPVNVARVYKEVSDRFVQDHPDFLGTKIIYSPYRGMSQKKFDKHLSSYKNVKAAYPDFITGFDLVGQEDKGHPLIDFADKLINLSSNATFFFHAGETNWYGHTADQNLFDAVLLNTKRIGHGLALLKHPKLMDIVKEKKIAIELNPISNQVLKFVDDMRNHPASYFFAENFPLVVSNDDPSFWGASGLSYDFYETFVGIMSRDADLRALKQLAINSIIYSSLTTDEQKQAFEIFDKSWQRFVTNLAQSPECVNRI